MTAASWTTRASAKPCPRIEYALRHGARLILASHLGRPKGKPNPKMSLKPVAERLRILLDDVLRARRKRRLLARLHRRAGRRDGDKLEQGQTLLLENLRFHAEEEANDENFAKQLAQALRLLCERCVRLRASRARLHRRHHALRREERCRPADGERTGVSGQSACSIRRSRSSRSWAAPRSATRSA